MLHGVGATYSQCDYITLVGAKWCNNWSANPPLCQGIEAVPMIYGASSAGQPVGGNSEWILWFNEPEQNGQGNYITPENAAALWNDNVGKYPGKKHVSPGVSADLTWLSRFLVLVNPKPNALAVHYYAWRDLETEVARTKEFLRQTVALAQTYGVREVWLTEWAVLPSYMPQDCLEYERRMFTEILPSFPQITRQAWFQVSYLGTESWAFGAENNTSLVGYSDGLLTPFGQVYKEAVSGQMINPNWDERADVTEDGIVDIFDIALVAGHFGDKKYT